MKKIKINWDMVFPCILTAIDVMMAILIAYLVKESEYPAATFAAFIYVMGVIRSMRN